LLVVLEEAYTGSCVLLLLLLDESWRLTKGREGRDWRIGNGLFQVPQSLHRPPHPSPAQPSPALPSEDRRWKLCQLKACYFSLYVLPHVGDRRGF